jgi:Tfp pilus assembly protein PilN
MQPPAIEILRAVTNAVPRDSWVFTFDLEGQTLRLTGFSHDVPSMLRSLQTLKWIHSIDFKSPAVHDSSQQGDRFDVLIQIAKAA